MRADGCHQDHGVLGVAEGSPGGEVVGCGARGGGDADAVRLHGREMFVVTEDFDRGHGRVGTAVDDDIVEDLEGAGGFVRVLVLALLADEFFDQVRTQIFVGLLGPHHGAFEAEAQRHGDAFFKGCGERMAEAAEVEFGEEAKGAEGKGEDWRDDALEKPAGVEESAVAAQGDADVEGFGMFRAELIGPVLQSATSRSILRYQTVGVELHVVL